MSNVYQLDAQRPRSGQLRPHPDRVELIRNWHHEQANPDHVPVACLNITITDCGQVKTSGIAIEPAHAMIFLAELESVSRRLRAFVVKQAPELLLGDSAPNQSAAVIPMHRPA